MAKASEKKAGSKVEPVEQSVTPRSEAPEVGAVRTIELSGPPFLVGEKRVARIAVEPLTFVSFAAMIKAAEIASAREKSPQDASRKHFRREQMRRMLRAYDEAGSAIPLQDGDLLMMPRAYVSVVGGLIDYVAEPMGEVLSDDAADGTTSPIHYRLGTPMRMGSRDGEAKDAIEFAEIEFQAKTLGDIEDVIAFDRPTDQAIALLRNCATPLGAISLQRPTDAMISQITMTDGLLIVEKVLPRFLE